MRMVFSRGRSTLVTLIAPCALALLFVGCGGPTGPAAPAAVTGLTASATSSTVIALSWQAATGATSYRVYRGAVLLPTVVTATTYSDVGLTPLTSYSYTVAACSEVAGTNCGAQSSAASVSTLATTFALSVTTAGTGTGTVTSTPAGISCGTTCSAPFTNGSSVSLTAAAATGSSFTGWSAGACSGTAACVITITAAQAVTATFALAPPAAFNLTSPANGTSSASTTPTLTWGASTGAASYTVEVATSTAFGTADVVNQTGVTATSFAVATPLTVGVIYYWRVTAINVGGSAIGSNAPLWLSSPYSAGTKPWAVAISPDGTKALVTNQNATGTVTVVSLATHAVTATVPVGASPDGIAITPDGTQALVMSGSGINVINISTGAVTKTIAAGCAAGVGVSYDIAITPDGLRAVIPNLNPGCTVEGIDLVNIASSAVTFVNLATSGVAYSVAILPNGTQALVTTYAQTTSIKTVNLSTSAVGTIAGTGGSYGVAVTPDNATALVVSGNDIKRVTLATGAIAATIVYTANASYRHIAITPDGTKAVVVGIGDVAIISLADNTILAKYPGTGGNVAIAPDGKTALITDSFNGKLCVIRIP